MKHLLKLVVLIGMIITTFASCKKEQAIADFKASVTYGKTPLTVLFTN
jgi:PKD repeat protein